mgnify:CR=1 FL=1
MSLGRSSRFCFLGPAKVKSETVLSSFASASLPPVFIMVVCCVAGILDTDIGKTLMNMEMLKFLRARSDTRLYPQYQSECAFLLLSCSITVISVPNWI